MDGHLVWAKKLHKQEKSLDKDACCYRYRNFDMTLQQKEV